MQDTTLTICGQRGQRVRSLVAALTLAFCSTPLYAGDAIGDAGRLPGFSQLANIPGPDHCTVLPDAQMPLIEGHGRMLSPVDIEGRPFMMLIDSGAAGTALSPQTAASLNENEDRSKTIRVGGVGGRMDGSQHPLIVHSIRFGSLNLSDFDVVTAHIERAEVESDAAAAAGMVGVDLLSRFDVEFDFPNHRLSLYHVAACSGRFAPWTGKYDAFMATRTRQGTLLVPVVLNGVTLRALIDTGSNVSSIAASAAAWAGVDARAMEGDPAMSFAGARGDMMTAHKHRFDTMSVGAATFHNVRLSVQDQDFPGIDMLLGMDFLRWRKVWLSYGTNQVFIQYTPPPGGRNPATRALPPHGAPGAPSPSAGLEAGAQ
ncbi:retropepsin-like aspartic protease [Paraburkholderia heleia]|uniref:retropepsin-like aspartic protease n=1 Tax=Paraburkholderia heleia TaxID=634127 RepID=UPI002AB73EE2|nr:retropepsin-like aspartic protease [Paraburkholderia heleia]